MGLFTKRQPIDSFNANYAQLKAMAFKHLVEAKSLVEEKIGEIPDDEYDVIVIQCLEQLLGEDHPEPGPYASEKAKKIYPKAYKFAKKNAKKIREIPVFDAFYAAVLDYKDDTLTNLLDDKWTESPEGKRVDAIIRDTPKSIEETEMYQNFWQDISSLK